MVTKSARAALDAGQSIIVLTSHNCNWEWCLLKLSFAMGHPIHATYKPLKGRFGDELMLTIRSRFGAEMISARRLLMRVMRYRGPARIVAMVTDQAPTSSGVRYFTQFMGLDTAFFIGPEAIARAAGLPVYYLAMRRESRGRYRVSFVPDCRGRRGTRARRADRALRSRGRVADARAPARLAVELPALEGAARRRGQSARREVGAGHRAEAARSDISNAANTDGYLAFLKGSDTMRRK